MGKSFNVTAVCVPEEHYMVNIDERVEAIKGLVDAGKYFTINRARQYGKTTLLRALNRSLQKEYYVVSMDFQTFDAAKFENGNVFSLSFAASFLRQLKRNHITMTEEFSAVIAGLRENIVTGNEKFTLMELFEALGDLCSVSDKPVVLMIDEVDNATNDQVFLDFLSQLRAAYIDRDIQPTFQSVILAGVYDVRNLKRKFRAKEDHKLNSPWNIAADFKIEMSFSVDDIVGMLKEYETDHNTGMDIAEMAGLLYDYTSGYPFLVSRICKYLDEEANPEPGTDPAGKAWNRIGFHEAVKMILMEKNTLFETLSEKLMRYPELSAMLCSLLFTGRSIVYNFYEPATNIATVLGFVKNQGGILAVANRIFDTWLYNFYLSAAKMQSQDIYRAALEDKQGFIVDGHLNMKLILERFAVHFNDLYGNSDEVFIEEEGRKYFLLYLKPIINGTGNYYVESRTRGLHRTDVIVDYNGEQYVIEMKIWRGEEYNNRGERQLVGYLDDYHMTKGYMISFNFNKKKAVGIREIIVGDKTLIEAVV